MKNNKLTILIYSCWKNNDMWDIFSALFSKYWSDCSYSVVLLTDRLEYTSKSWVFTDIIEYDSTWGNMILNGLSNLESKYVSLWMDDYLLCDYVDNKMVRECIEFAETTHSGLLRLGDLKFCTMETNNRVKPRKAYSLSLQVGIWNVDFLKKHINPLWSAWDFERIGSLEIEDEEYPIYYYSDYEIPYVEGVRQGKWMHEGAKLCRRNQIELDTVRRPIMTEWEMAKLYIKGAIISLNPTLVLKCQNIFARK